jgi:glycosyltransferase involved in cell wall biosynthesis
MFVSLLNHLPKTVSNHELSEVKISCLQPEFVRGWLRGQKRVVFTMWETSELPDNCSSVLSQFDQIVVPCLHNVELFSKYHKNVTIVHLGIDPKIWKLSTSPMNNRFRFIAGGSSWLRKGLDLVVQAFERLNLPDAELVIKVAESAKAEIPTVSHPNIILIDNWLTLGEEYDLYATADCFVAASRGEGFGLMPLQTIAMGIPTIMSDMTGQSDFINLASTAVPAPATPARHPKVWNKGDWYEVSIDDLCEAMLHEYTLGAGRRDPQKAAAAAKMTWQKSSAALVKTAGTGGLLSERVWMPADEPTIMVTAKRRITADIGRHAIRMEKGETKLVSPNVRGILLGAGYLQEDN